MLVDKQLNLVVDMFGCPNRCLHCWLGHMPNRIMEPDADQFIMDYFDPFFEKIAYYSWLREPDYCDNYVKRWEKDIALSKNAMPKRFELASFYRIVRDNQYIPFLRSVGVKKVQLTFFGLKDMQDKYVGRKGAYEEVMAATDLLHENGIIPRWQCFINEENKDEIVDLYHIAKEKRRMGWPELEFFVHEGSCDGENRKLYPIRIQKDHIPDELKSVYLNYNVLTSEKECYDKLINDDSHPLFPIGDEITLNISNDYSAFYNYTNMSIPWTIGNLKKDNSTELVQRIVEGNTYAIRKAMSKSWAELVQEYGNPMSERVFDLDDYKMFLVNNFLEQRKEL